MTTTPAHTASDAWAVTTPARQASESQARAHEIVRDLRAVFAALGLPPDQVQQILPTSDIERRGMVRLGTLTVAAAEIVLRALTGPPEGSS
ncbi:hypothetical protein [Streptomyces sp. IBSBF 2435]|uniref:hypothetical protein n=1 Tax=Streptomyces sp. IBSBF 2435 TaxID=2903531 RepID=UPI002FDC5545